MLCLIITPQSNALHPHFYMHLSDINQQFFYESEVFVPQFSGFFLTAFTDSSFCSRVCLVAGHVCSSRSGAVVSGFVWCGRSHADTMWSTRPHFCVLHAGVLYLQRGSSALLRPLGLCSAVSITLCWSLACAS